MIAAVVIGAWCAIGQDAPAAGGPLSVGAMTFNIRYGTGNDGEHVWPNRRALVVKVMAESGADFIGLQEAMAFQIAELRDALGEYSHYGRGRRADPQQDEACPIFFRTERWRIDEERRGTFWLSDTPDEPGSMTWGNRYPRIVTYARFIEKESGRAVWVYNTHFDHESQPARMNAARMIARRIAERPGGEPFVLMGDFNAGEENEAIGYLTGAGDSPVRLADTYRELMPDAEEVGTFNGFTDATTGEKIDYIFVDPTHWAVTGAAIHRDRYDGIWPSDHLPVSAVLVGSGR